MKTTHPATLPFHPKPIDTQVTHMPTGHGTVTSIARRWPPGAAASCRLCAGCTARNDACLISIDGYVSEEEAPAFSSRGLIAPDDPGFVPLARRNRVPLNTVGLAGPRAGRPAPGGSP